MEGSEGESTRFLKQCRRQRVRRRGVVSTLRSLFLNFHVFPSTFERWIASLHIRPREHDAESLVSSSSSRFRRPAFSSQRHPCPSPRRNRRQRQALGDWNQESLARSSHKLNVTRVSWPHKGIKADLERRKKWTVWNVLWQVLITVVSGRQKSCTNEKHLSHALTARA